MAESPVWEGDVCKLALQQDRPSLEFCQTMKKKLGPDRPSVENNHLNEHKVLDALSVCTR